MQQQCNARLCFYSNRYDIPTQVNSISDTCDVRNLGSARVMEKTGLRQVERFADYDEKANQPTASYRYRVLRNEWEKVSQ